MIRHPGGILVCYYTAGGASCIAWDSVGHSPTLVETRTSAVTGAVLPRYPESVTQVSILNSAATILACGIPTEPELFILRRRPDQRTSR